MEGQGLTHSSYRAEAFLWLVVPPIVSVVWIKLAAFPEGSYLRWIPLALSAIALSTRVYGLSALAERGRLTALPIALISGTVAGIAWYWLAKFFAIYGQLWIWWSNWLEWR